MTEPAWLVAAVDQRLALMVESMGPATEPIAKEYGIMVTPLTEPPENPTKAQMELWDRTCDVCGKDCNDTVFYTGHAVRRAFGTTVCFTFGICGMCKDIKKG